MSRQNIRQLFDDVNVLLDELSVISTEKGFHIDHNLESVALMLMLENDEHELILLKHRLETAKKKLLAGTFKVTDIDKMQTKKAA